MVTYLYSDELLLSGFAVWPLLPKAEEDFEWWWGVGLAFLEQDELCSETKMLSQRLDLCPWRRGGQTEHGVGAHH